MPAIHVQNLNHRFGQAVAIRDLSFSVADGSFVVIAGCSGAGKTTLLRLLAGLETIQSGTICFGEQDVTAWPANKRGIVMVRQDSALYPQLTALQNVTLSLRGRAKGEEAERLAVAALTSLRVGELVSKFPSELSGGEAQRVALARALVAEPKLLLLDEPLSQVDGVHKEVLIDAIREASQGTTTLMVSHDPWDTLRLAHEVVLLEAGSVLQSGPTGDVYEKPTSRLAGHLLAPIGMNWIPVAEVAPELQANGLEAVQGKTWLGFRPESVQFMPRENDTPAGLHLELNSLKQSSLGVATLIEGAWKDYCIRALQVNAAPIDVDATAFVPESKLHWVDE